METTFNNITNNFNVGINVNPDINPNTDTDIDIDKVKNVYEIYKSIYGEPNSIGKIYNRIPEYDEKVCGIIGLKGKNNGKCLYEIHVFLEPIWMDPSQISIDTVEKYKNVGKCFNDYFSKIENTYGGFKKMGSPVLTLLFNKKTEVTVLQSSLYYSSNDIKRVIGLTKEISSLYANCGFNVVREKIEVMTHGIDGLPESSDDNILNHTYYEYHLKLKKDNIHDNSLIRLNSEEYNTILKLSEDIEKKYNTTVPLSYNRSNDISNNIEKEYQRYLNLRFRKISITDVNTIVNEIIEHIQNNSSLIVAKTHREYIVYDTYNSMDDGWIQ